MLHDPFLCVTLMVMKQIYRLTDNSGKLLGLSLLAVVVASVAWFWLQGVSVRDVLVSTLVFILFYLFALLILIGLTLR